MKKKMNKKKSLKKQFEVLTIGFCTVIILAIISVCLFLILPSLQKVKQEEKNMQNQVQRNIEYKLDNARKIAEGIGYDEIVQRFLRAKDADSRITLSEQIRSIASKLSITDKTLDAIYIFYDGGKILNYPIGTTSVSAVMLPTDIMQSEDYTGGIGHYLESYLYYSCAVYDNDINNFVFDKRIGTVVVVFDAEKAFSENEMVCDYVITDSENNVVMSNSDNAEAGEVLDKAGFVEPIAIEGTENFIIFRNENNYRVYLSIRMGIFILIAIIVCIILFFANNMWLYKGFLRPIDTVVREIRAMKAAGGSYMLSEDIADNTECEEIIGAINFFIQENEKRNNDILEMKENIYRQETMSKAMEAEYLRQQIKPHFLYNTLGCIRNIAMRNGLDIISVSITSLISILRYGTNSLQNVLIRDELEIIRQYVELLNLRFGNKFLLDVSIDGDLEDTEIAKLLIQPVVENCINHAYRDFDGLARIDIKFEKHGEYISITVRDYGYGIEEERLFEIVKNLEKESPKAGSVGMYNVNKRIKLIYGEDCGLAISSRPGEGTAVTIKIKERMQNEQKT
ncbi:MAG: histidine kinase [Clostridia bacterium]|nr:histidine kinase [Clostridia bacterium]